ncbi:hypothetical protein FRC07_008514, partial [Ceratobasidium sp. 392]
MWDEHPKWGPEFDQYMDEFEDRFNEAFDNYVSARETKGIAHDGLLPLSLLETMLTVGDNMHKVDYQHGEKSLTVLMATIRRYTELNKNGIFEYYYGYLCMRHLMRTICIGTLIESKVFEAFLNDLDPDMDAVEATDALAQVAFDLMTQALMKNDLAYVGLCLGFKPPSWDVFQCVGGLSFDDVDFLITTIWKNRQRLVALIQHGMLVGFPALLFTLCQMTLFSKAPESTKKWAQLQEIILRCYLVGVREEQITLRQLALSADLHMTKHDLVGNSKTDPEDAHVIIRAYTRVLRPLWDHNNSVASILPLDISNILFRYVDSLLTSELADCIPEVARVGLERIWLELDRETDGFMAAPRRGFTRHYASDIFHYLGDIQQRLQTRKNELAFSNMLVEIDILGLVGRLLLMISREGSNPDKWNALRDDLQHLCDTMPEPIRATDSIAQCNIAEWIKFIGSRLKLLSLFLESKPILNRATEAGFYLREDITCCPVISPLLLAGVMKRDHPKWGLNLGRYLEVFNDRIEKAFDNYMTSQETTSVAHDGLLPLSVLGTMPIVGENMHKFEYQHGEKPLSVLMATIRRYAELNETGVSPRTESSIAAYIMRTICIGTPIENETLNDFLDNLDADLDTIDASEMLAEKAFEQMTEALFKNDLSHVSICLGCMPPNGDAFTHVGGLSYNDVELLVLTLWKDRRSIMTLSNHGMLPGFPALLFTLCEMTIFSRAPHPTKQWTQLQDILLRFYIVGTKEERQTIRQLSLFIHEQIIRYKLVGDSTTDEEDASNVVRAYIEIFYPLLTEGLAPVMLLDISSIIFRFVDCMVTSDLADCIPKVTWGGLERLWLEFDREKEGFMAAPRRGFTRRYASEIFQMIG